MRLSIILIKSLNILAKREITESTYFIFNKLRTYSYNHNIAKVPSNRTERDGEKERETQRGIKESDECCELE